MRRRTTLHRGFRYSPGLIRLGRIRSPIEALRFLGNRPTRFEIAKG